MTPILGIMASGMSGNLWAPGKDYDSIATTTVGGGGAASITFSSIPSTYRHLQIRGIARSTFNNASFGTVDLYVQDSTPSSTVTYGYSHTLRGDGSAASAYSGSGGLVTTLKNVIPAFNAAASTFGVLVIDILDYANTNKNITTRALGGGDLNGATPGSVWNGAVALTSESWSRTLATSVLTLTVDGNFAQYSQLALYGVK